MRRRRDGRATVVWDLGNVLIPWDRRRLFARLIDDPAELDHFCDHVLTLDENAVLDRGTPLPEMVSALAARHPRYRAVIEAFGTRWPETVGPPISGSVALLQEVVSRGHRCLALTNWGSDTFDMVSDDYEFLDLFEGIVVSGREGTIKPERAIFDIMCTRHAVDPSASVFIDDSDVNVSAAQDIGFDAIRFTSPPQLRRALARRALIGP